MVSNTWGLSDLRPLRLRHLRYTYILNFNQSYWVVDCCEHISTHRPRSQNLSWLSPGRVVQTVTWAVSSQQSTSGIGSDPIPNHFAHTTDERTPCWTLSWTNQRCRMIFHLQAPYFCTPFRWKMPPCLVLVDQTVDERNPVPVNMKNMPSVLGFHKYICICMNWCRVSSINHTNLFFIKIKVNLILLNLALPSSAILSLSDINLSADISSDHACAWLAFRHKSTWLFIIRCFFLILVAVQFD